MARHADLRHAQFLCLPAMHWPLLRGSVASSRHKWPRHRYSYDASNVQALGTLKASYSAHRRVVQWYMHCSGRCLRRGGMSYAVCIQELCADDFVDKMPEDEKLWILSFLEPSYRNWSSEIAERDCGGENTGIDHDQFRHAQRYLALYLADQQDKGRRWFVKDDGNDALPSVCRHVLTSSSCQHALITALFGVRSCPLKGCRR